MRKLTAVCFALLVTVSAVAAPPNDSTERNTPNPIARVVKLIKSIVRTFDEPQLINPVPNVPTP